MYSIDDIKSAWNAYETRKTVRVLRNGSWVYVNPVSLRNTIDGTRAEVIDLKKTMSFPEFLEKEWKK